MNRRTSIIVSITGIVIIILTLLGLTYGYYVSKITGNESTKSIEVITGDSSVRFTDLSENDISEIIEPGFTTTKSFTVENTGNIGATYSIYFVDVYNDFVRTEDIVYTLYRIDNDSTFPTDYEGCIENPTNEKSCKIVVNNAEFPTSVALIKANEVITAPGDTFRYDLVITYINQPDINQNVDQGHTFKGSINLRASMDDLDNPFSEGTLAYSILNNSINKLNGTKYIDPTLQDGTNYSIPAEQINNADERILTYTEDDYGTSYYFRGNVIDNYVNFSGMCWRIVRIAGDGAIKLLLEDAIYECDNALFAGNWRIGHGSYGFTLKKVTNSSGQESSSSKYVGDYLNGQTNSSDAMKTKLDSWLISSGINTIKLKKDSWCLGNITDAYDYSTGAKLENTINDLMYNEKSFYYDAAKRLYGKGETANATLKCSMNNYEVHESYIGTITADEVVYAGGKAGNVNYNYYLLNEDYYWRTLSRVSFEENYDNVFFVDVDGALGNDYVSDYDDMIRPVITLKSNTKILGGAGLLGDPYIVE